MTLSATERRVAARRLALEMFGTSTADVNVDDLAAAIGAIDDAMDAQASEIDPQTLTVKQFLVLSLPEPFKSSSTANEKAIALMVWAMKEVGMI